MPVRDEKAVGLVLVTYGSAEDLPPFLESLPAAIEPLTLKVVAVDNASNDDSAELVERFDGKVIRNRENVGLTRAINQGARELETDWILVANPDTRLTAGAIATLVETARSDDRIGVVGPRVSRLDGTPYPTGRRFPSIGVGIAHALLGAVWKSNPATRAYFGNPATTVSDVDWISGCCMLFRRSAFEAVGGYDERYFMYFEETKIALDLHRAGYRVVLDPTVEIRHREGGSTRHAPFRKVRNHHRSALRFYVDYNRSTPWILFTPLVAAGLIVRGSLSMLRTALARGR
ncbi:glycosyltransferase family 2 protein [Nocardia sp. bgisy118]|uniref:glycosyltransferase family 2 protein n=1 Tax=Nocardia sp. bgisy118 TaxID=3413786 RepID=UPI003F4A62D3